MQITTDLQPYEAVDLIIDDIPYPSTLRNVHSDTAVFYTPTDDEWNLLTISPQTEINLRFQRGHEIYSALIFAKRTTLNHLLETSLPQRFQITQRRQYYRLEINLNLTVVNLGPPRLDHGPKGLTEAMLLQQYRSYFAIAQG